MRKGAAHWPTNSAQSSLPLSFKIADAAIEPRRSLGSLPFNCACEPIFTALPTFDSGFHLDISSCRTLRCLGNVLQQPSAKVNRELSSNTEIFYPKVR